MKQIIFLIFTVLLFSSQLEAQQKLSKRQEKLAYFIKKYQDAIKKAPDSLTKVKIYSDMWRKHIV
nr:hypothetical protein [Chitinophagaceae bacterium]